jgi:hypothetical protein
MNLLNLMPHTHQIRRLSSWQDEMFIDRQPVETVSVFYLSVGIYAFLLFVDIFNIINAVITLRYGPHSIQ